MLLIILGGPGGRGGKPGADQFKSRVELRIECKNLLNKDVMSKSDPCAAFYMMRGGRWEEVGQAVRFSVVWVKHVHVDLLSSSVIKLR